MSNMSYCRFQNTAPDLSDCADNLPSLDPEDQSFNTTRERQARRNLIETAANILCELGIDDPSDSHQISRVIDAMDDGEGYEADAEDEEYA